MDQEKEHGDVEMLLQWIPLKYDSRFFSFVLVSIKAITRITLHVFVTIQLKRHRYFVVFVPMIHITSRNVHLIYLQDRFVHIIVTCTVLKAKIKWRNGDLSKVFLEKIKNMCGFEKCVA